jgi:hypothetical protein
VVSSGRPMLTFRSEIEPYHRPSQLYLALGRLKPRPRRSRTRDASTKRSGVWKAGAAAKLNQERRMQNRSIPFLRALAYGDSILVIFASFCADLSFVRCSAILYRRSQRSRKCAPRPPCPPSEPFLPFRLRLANPKSTIIPSKFREAGS